jgi:hypothetical protein
MTGTPSRQQYVEGLIALWRTRGVDAVVATVGPEAVWHPHGAERRMTGPELLQWTREREADGVRRRVGQTTFEEFGPCVLVHTSVRDYDARGFTESTSTLLYEFEGDRLIEARSFCSPEGARLAARASMWRRQAPERVGTGRAR